MFSKNNTMQRILCIFFLLFQFVTIAQKTISGKVLDSNNNPIFGANIYLETTYDGSSTDTNGNFSFSTSETGIQTLVVSFISFETYLKTADVTSFNNLKIKLKDDVNALDAVVINAGTFETGENAKVTVLKPLDIVTTASALGDFVGALQTLPGTTTVAEDGRLFVRGGEAEETQIFIDGIRVFTPFTPTTNNIPTRGRYSPFLFKGVTFSTGGYSAEYGQALSSVLLLNTIDEPDQEKTDLTFMTVGLGVGNTQKWDNNSFSINASYINLSPYLKAFPDKNSWQNPLQSINGEMVFRHKFNDQSLLKLYGAYSYSNFDVIQENINYTNGFRLGLQNTNLYFNGSYKNKWKNNWKIETGFSITNDNTTIKPIEDFVKNNQNSIHVKTKIKKQISTRTRFNFGAEYFYTNFSECFSNQNIRQLKYGFHNTIFASFVETELFFSKKLATKIGFRAEKTTLFNEFTISPRASISYKSGKNSQFSFAYGQFYQNPSNQYLKFSSTLNSENTSHLIANFQRVKKNEIFRIEAYYKNYNNLIKFKEEQPTFSSNFNNNGYGFAKGIDLFWRQNGKIKNTDYWISYSFLDTKRDYKNYPYTATPSFTAAHNLSVVGKHWIENWKSQVGFSYSFASGRNYTNPNKDGFLNATTKNYNSVSVNWAYLLDQQKIVYFSVNNVLGTKNVFGYNYKNTPNSNGNFDRQAIVPNADSFFFIGFFWTVSDYKKSNQLDNL